MSSHRLHVSFLTKMLVTVVIASSACCETAVQQQLSCFMFTDSRDQEESKLSVCSIIRPIDWSRRAFAASISHTIRSNGTNPVVFFMYPSLPLSLFPCTLQEHFKQNKVRRFDFDHNRFLLRSISIYLHVSLIFESASSRFLDIFYFLGQYIQLAGFDRSSVDKIRLVFSSR